MHRFALLSCLLLLPLSSAHRVSAQTPTVPEGVQFQVNTYTTSDQRGPALAMTPEGVVLVVWTSYGSDNGDTSGPSVQGQRFASDGEPLGVQFRVNTYTAYFQDSPAVAVAPAGDFVVVWQSGHSDNGDDDPGSIQGQRYASNGEPLGGQFLVNTYTTSVQSNPVLAVNPAGGFVVVWTSYGSNDGDTWSTSVQGQRYNTNGEPLGGQFQVNTYTTNSQNRAALAVAPAGDFVVVWTSYGSDNGDTSSTSIQGQRYTSGGEPLGGQFLVNTYTPRAQEYPAVAVGSTGDFVVVWNNLDLTTWSSSIEGQRYASDGEPLGGQFQVNTYTADGQYSPSVVTDPEDDFVVVWRSFGSDAGDTSSWSAQGRRYTSNGEAIGNQFQVNAYTTDFQSFPAVGVDAAGDFVVVWESRGSDDGDTSGFSIQGQRFRVTADIGDRVFLDADFDARQDASEPGIPGVAVHLRSSLGTLLASTETDSAGRFLFRPKIALQGVVDSFYLQFEAPLLSAFTAPDVGADDEIDSDASTVLGETATFQISSAGERHLHLDAGLIDATAAIGDRVWNDANQDGIQQVDEDGVAGVSVRLLDAGDDEVGSTTTNSEGLYSFVGVATGTYSIAVLPPTGAEPASQDAGSDDEIDSDVDPLTARSAPFVYSAGTIDRSHDVGLVGLPIFADGFESGDLSAWSGVVGSD